MPDPRDGADWTRGVGCLMVLAGVLLVYVFAAVFGLLLRHYLPPDQLKEFFS